MVEKYSKDYLIRTNECDKNGELRLVTLMNIFQDMADEHAAQMGLGLEYCLAKGLAWVGSNYHLKIGRMPRLHEKITLITWPAVEKKLGAVRDFVINDAAGTEIVCASSQWILIDAAKKRPLALRENLPQYYTERDVQWTRNLMPACRRPNGKITGSALMCVLMILT